MKITTMRRAFTVIGLVVVSGILLTIGWRLDTVELSSIEAARACMSRTEYPESVSCLDLVESNRTWSFWSSVCSSLATGFIGSVVILAIVDWYLRVHEDVAVAIRRRRILVERLVARTRSASASESQVAVAELRSLGAFADGSLVGVNWSRANLTGVDLEAAILDHAGFASTQLTGASLSYAKLRRADLGNAILNDVKLAFSDLTGAAVSQEQLMTTYMLWGATLPDGSRYDGRYNLKGDLQAALERGIDISDEANRITFFQASKQIDN